MFGQSPLLSGGAAMVAVGGLGLLFSSELGHALLELFRTVGAAPTSTLSVSESMARFRGAVAWLSCFICAPALLLALCAVLVPALASRRHRGSTAVPLPEKRSGILESLAPRLVAAIATGLLLVRAALSARYLLAETGARELLGPLAHLAASFLVTSGAVLMLAGSVEAALRGMAIRRCLSLSSADARREERYAGGAKHKSPMPQGTRGIRP
ncbi:MAG: hypothetical protein MUC50_04360 [Myxococcota bacterium]|nr:hypothetical protein [Myxococcota bacterium]